VSLYLARYYKMNSYALMYVSVNKQLTDFRNCFGVLCHLWQGKGMIEFSSLQMNQGSS